MSAVTAGEVLTPRRSLLRVGLRRFRRRPVAVGALAVLLAIFAVGALAHVLVGASGDEIDLLHVKNGPSLAHLFGTDNVGRDVLERTVYGIRTSELVALSAAGIATVVGVVAGLLAGYFGGWLDAVIMRIADLVTAYPAVVFTLAAFVYFRPVWPHTLIVVFSSFMWATVARAVRADVVRLRETEFVEAARALGASGPRILFRHLLPNTLGTVIVSLTSLIGLVALSLYYIGLKRTPAMLASLAELTYPVIAVVAGIYAYNAHLRWTQWIGAAIIIGVVSLLPLQRRRKVVAVPQPTQAALAST